MSELVIWFIALDRKLSRKPVATRFNLRLHMLYIQIPYFSCGGTALIEGGGGGGGMREFDNILTAVCRRRLLPVKSVAINISLEE